MLLRVIVKSMLACGLSASSGSEYLSNLRQLVELLAGEVRLYYYFSLIFTLFSIVFLSLSLSLFALFSLSLSLSLF